MEPIAERTFKFSLEIIRLSGLIETQRKFVLANQLLRSGTSIGANVQEATAAQSKKDFIHKMSIASKEARETRYWLQLIHHSGFHIPELDQRLAEIESIVKILTKIVKTSQSQYPNSKT